MEKKINIELWFEILDELNQFLVQLKPLPPILLFVTFFRQHLPFSKHIFECTRNGVVPYTVKNPKSQWRSGVSIVNFEHI